MHVDDNDELPHNIHVPLGKEVNINTFVDLDHTRNKLTHIFYIGILSYMSMAPVIFNSTR